jgi:hypothetical protein
LQAHFYFAYAAVKTLKVRSSKNKKELSISLVAQHKDSSKLKTDSIGSL